MGLGRFLDSSDYITWKQLLEILGSVSGHKSTSWIEKRGFPIYTKKVRNASFRVVKIDEFWKWAEEHKELLDFSRFEENILGKEPEWAKEKRRLDKEKNRKYKTSPWTKTEEEQLKFLLRQQKYTYNEIAQKLGRNEGAIQVRMLDLKVKDRPLKAKAQVWNEEQKETLIHLIEKGYSYELLAEQLGRSSKAIRGFVYRIYGTENLDKVRKVLKKE